MGSMQQGITRTEGVINRDDALYRAEIVESSFQSRESTAGHRDIGDDLTELFGRVQTTLEGVLGVNVVPLESFSVDAILPEGEKTFIACPQVSTTLLEEIARRYDIEPLGGVEFLTAESWLDHSSKPEVVFQVFACKATDPSLPAIPFVLVNRNFSGGDEIRSLLYGSYKAEHNVELSSSLASSSLLLAEESRRKTTQARKHGAVALLTGLAAFSLGHWGFSERAAEREVRAEQLKILRAVEEKKDVQTAKELLSVLDQISLENFSAIGELSIKLTREHYFYLPTAISGLEPAEQIDYLERFRLLATHEVLDGQELKIPREDISKALEGVIGTVSSEQVRFEAFAVQAYVGRLNDGVAE